MFSNSVVIASLISLVTAANITIEVGQDGNSFTPSTITADIDDTVTFDFTGSRHDVVQSSFEDPCAPLSGGFYVPAQTMKAQFIVTINSTDPLYFYCSVGRHCGVGMVGIINP
jgi:plastocyanin